MIVLPKPQLKFLLSGRSVPIEVSREYRQGRVYPVSTTNSKTVYHARVLEVVPVEGTRIWKLTLTNATEEKRRFLAATPGHLNYRRLPPSKPGALGRWEIDSAGDEHQDYTTDPRRGVRGEPEAVDPQTQEKFSRHGRENDLARASQRHDETPTAQQVADLERRADQGDQQARRHLFMIKKHLTEAAERKSRDAA